MNKCMMVILRFSLAVFLCTSVFAQTSDADTVAAITKLENDAVKADLAGDTAFAEKYMADGWTGGTSRGTFDTKESLLSDMKDTAHNKMKSEKMSDLKVRSYGDVAVATYTSTYDAMIEGKHYARTIVCTDTFQNQSNSWKEIATAHT